QKPPRTISLGIRCDSPWTLQGWLAGFAASQGYLSYGMHTTPGGSLMPEVSELRLPTLRDLATHFVDEWDRDVGRPTDPNGANQTLARNGGLPRSQGTHLIRPEPGRTCRLA